jgi:hypothetical protein
MLFSNSFFRYDPAQMEKKRTDGVERIGSVLEKSLKRLELSSALSDYGIWPVWNDVVGSVIARNAQPEKFRGGTLFVRVSSPTWMQQLQYVKGMIADKLNDALGREVVKNVFFVVGRPRIHEPEPARRAAPAPLAEEVAAPAEFDSIKDPEIRRALTALFRNSRARPKS